MGPDLATMFNNGMGATASGMAGQMFSTDQAQQAEKLKAMQLENAQTAVMNPLNSQFKQGEINRQGAELPGIVGTSQSLGAKGQEDVATLPAKIAATLSSKFTQIGEDGWKQMSGDAEKLSHAAQIMKTYPPAMQGEVFSNVIKQYGGNPNNPMFKGILEAPPEKQQLAAETLSKGMSLASSKYLQDSTTHAATAASNERIHAANNATSITVAEKMADSRVKAAETRANAMGDKVDVLQKLLKVPMANRDAEWNAQYSSAMTSLTTLKAATGGDLAAAMIGGGKPMTTSERTSDAVSRVTTMNSGAPSAAPASKSDFESMAKQTWPNDDPSKYVYSLNPDTGRIRRMPK